jgi:low temperature requirement protein LtrA
MNSFYNDDLAQRVLILWIMAILVVYGNNAVHVDEDIGAMRATVGAYLVARFSSNLTHLIYSFASYHHRVQQRLWFVLASMALCLYIPLFIEDLSFRSKIAVAATAIAVEESIWIFCYSPLAMRLTKAVYTTAVDIPHEVDRFAAFFIIVLGEYLYQIIVGSPAAGGFNIPLLRAIWTLIIAFSLNWLYIHNDGAMEGSHPLKHNIFASFAWVTLHLPMTACLLVAGHVSARSSQEEEIHGGELWLLCGGLGAGLICLFIIAMLHQSHDEPGVLMLPKVSFHKYCALKHKLTNAGRPTHSSTYCRYHHHLSASGPPPPHHRTAINYHGPGCSVCHLGECHITDARSTILAKVGEHKISREA